MDFINSFLVVTALTYYLAIFIPKRCDRKLPKNVERFVFFVMGSLILAAITINHLYLWGVLTGFYTVDSLLSYMGYRDWGSIWHNLFRCGWDLLLAVIFMSKV